MKVVEYLNLAGVFALAVLCCVQWEANRRVNLEAENLDRTRQDQAREISEQGLTIKGYMADLNDFRDRLEQCEKNLKHSEAELTKVTEDRDVAIKARDQAAAEREDCKANLIKWTEAVNARDQALKKAGNELMQIAKDRDDTVRKFNDLAVKYNAVVKQLNDSRKSASAH